MRCGSSPGLVGCTAGSPQISAGPDEGVQSVLTLLFPRWKPSLLGSGLWGPAPALKASGAPRSCQLWSRRPCPGGRVQLE